MKRVWLIGIILSILFLSACKEKAEETVEDVVITFFGVTEHVVLQGGSEIDLVSHVEAKDQFGKSYDFEVIEAIDYDVIARYEIIYRVEYLNEIFEKKTYVDVVLNEVRNQELHDELVDKLSVFQHVMNQNPYRFIRKNYDPAEDDNYVWVMSSEYNYLSHQIQDLLLINPSLTSTPETLNLILEQGSQYIALPVKGNYAYQPNTLDHYDRVTLLSEEDFIFGIVNKDAEGYSMFVDYQELAKYQGQNHLLAEIFGIYGYDLRQKEVSVLMKFIMTEVLVHVDVYYDIKDTSYDYYASLTYSLEVSEEIDLTKLSQVEALSFEDVILPINMGIHHEVVYDMMRTRYFKIEVEKDKSYEIRGLSIATLTYYNEAYQAVQLDMKTVPLWSGTRKWFTSPFDGDLYIKYQRNTSPIHDLFDFYVNVLPHVPTQETIILRFNDHSYQALSSFYESIKLVIPVVQGKTYRLSFDEDEQDIYIESGLMIESINNSLHITNLYGTEVILYIYGLSTIQWESLE